MNRFVAALGAVAFFAYLSGAALAGGGFSGVWTVKDTNGKDFDITLTEDGKASAEREGEGMSGTWKKDGEAAVITWNSGWTTKIEKSGDGYVKSAYDKGVSLDGEPTNTSAAKKVK